MKPNLLLGSIESDLPKFEGIPHKLYFPNAYPDELIYPMPGLNKTVDIGFCGNPGSGERHAYINFLAQHYGPRFKFDNFVIGKDMVTSLNSCRIQFNRNLANDINYRTFEAMGCKTLMVTNETENLSNLFKIGEHLLTYRDHNHLVEVLNWAISNPVEAAKIADAGYAHVKANHTYEVRCRWLLEQLKALV
jgi:glycosyltransferase involved in cell wall biosynthesis